MGRAGNLIFWFSLSGIFIIAVVSFLRNKNVGRLILVLTSLAIAGVLFSILFHQGADISSKGDQHNELIFIVILYGCMLIGMVFHYLFTLFMQPERERQPFSVGRLLAPVFASPIVFIPLLGAFQSLDVDLEKLTIPKIMVFFVAFENGFFWKEIVDNHGKGKNS